MRRQAAPAQTRNDKLHASTIIAAQYSKQQLFNSGLTRLTTSKDGPVSNRCTCMTIARHTELSSRPCARYTVVQVHNIVFQNCSDPHETTDGKLLQHKREQLKVTRINKIQAQ
jgi:hypothetical protein